MFPVTETKTIMPRVPSEVHNECHDQKPHDCNNFDTGEDKLGLSVDGYSEDVEADDKNDD